MSIDDLLSAPTGIGGAGSVWAARIRSKFADDRDGFDDGGGGSAGGAGFAKEERSSMFQVMQSRRDLPKLEPRTQACGL